MNGYFFDGRVLLFVFFLFAVGAPAEAEMEIRFNRDIRPILSDKCYRCHGPNQNARRAKLRLDVELEAKADRGEYFEVEAPVGADKGLAARMES